MNNKEEFEVHGPRLNRYAQNWAFYLGHHWGYRREVGEPQLTFNYSRALSDFLTNFTFSRGVSFRSPEATSAIIPSLLQRVWEKDNKKMPLLWEMGNMGSVSGDCFVKVAYEEAWTDPAGMEHPGKIRILPINSSFAFPEWHPHDRKRMIRFKLKYRFWGCHRTDVRALTRRGWKKHYEILPEDELLTIDPDTDAIKWAPHQGINVYDYDGEMIKWSGLGDRSSSPLDAFTTPNHRWLGEGEQRETVFSEFAREYPGRLVTGGGTPLEFRLRPKWDDALVESVAWYVCDGSDHVNRQNYHSVHLAGKKPHKVAAWRRLAEWWTAEGATWREGKITKTGQATFYLGKGVAGVLQEVAPNKEITPEFLCSLTYSQALLFHQTLIAGDGHVRSGSVRWTQLDEGRREGYQMLCAMLGIRTGLEASHEKVQEYASRYTVPQRLVEERLHYKGQVWCPTVPTGFFMAERNGTTYWTGNTTAEGTRQVFTYVELLTDEAIEEYVNDELIDQRPNPIGEIPIVHISNFPVASSPWGLSDIQDVIGLNREYNEKATDISDIINYHACVDVDTEALTRSGWKYYEDLSTDDELLCLDPVTDEIIWQPVESLNVYDYHGPMVQWDNRVDALTTPNHRWLAERRIGRPKNKRYEREFVRSLIAQGHESAAADLREGSRIILGGGVPNHFPTEQKYTDEFVETVAWFVTEGWVGRQGTSNRPVTILSQSVTKNPVFVRDLQRLQSYWKRGGQTFTEQRQRDNGVVCWYLGTDLTEILLTVAPDKSLSPEFIMSLTHLQAQKLLEVLVDGDGTRSESERITWYQDDLGRRDAIQMLIAMLQGGRTRSYINNRGDGVVDCYRTRTIEIMSTTRRAVEILHDGVVWCPTVPTGVWFARRNGNTYWTGNSPVTVIVGGKASNLEKGPKKVWSIPNEKAKIQNLELDPESVNFSLKYLETVKTAMHEMTGIPVTALGQEQPISNTSGVALAIQYQPLMLRYELKKMQYSEGITRINYLILRTLFLKEPWTTMWDPETDVPLMDGQLDQLDPSDPISYESECFFQPPLPVDQLVKLNEVQTKMGLGLESKRGALRDLGTEFVDQKLQELFKELLDDAEDQAALDLLKAQVANVIAQATGMFPGSGGPEPVPPSPAGGDGGVQSAGGPNVNTAGGAGPPMGGVIFNPAQQEQMMQRLVTRAQGTQLPQRRSPETDEDQ